LRQHAVSRAVTVGSGCELDVMQRASVVARHVHEVDEGLLQTRYDTGTENTPAQRWNYEVPILPLADSARPSLDEPRHVPRGVLLRVDQRPQNSPLEGDSDFASYDFTDLLPIVPRQAAARPEAQMRFVRQTASDPREPVRAGTPGALRSNRSLWSRLGRTG
jgi:hypothetical protein